MNLPAANSLPEVHLAHPHQLFINGRWVDAREGRRIDVVSAHSEQIIATVAEGTEADMDAAVAAARHAFDQGPWPRLSPAERAAWLVKLGEALAPRLPEISRAWVDQIGALAMVAPYVVGAGHFWFQYYANLANTFPFEEVVAPFDGHGSALVVREPVGVVAAIAPWNNPFGIMTGKLAPALLAGCTVVMKPAPETPLEAYIIAEAAEAIGLPPGVVNLVTAHREASDYLVRHAGIDKVSFTGSVVAGRRIAAVCGDRLARCTLELGGKSAAIVLDDYDVGDAARTLAQVITMSAGQVCATLSRVVVSANRADALAEALKAELEAVRVGDPNDPTTQMGPLAMARQRARVEDYIAIGRAEGACLASGGGRPAHLERGYYLQPTLFTQVKPGMRLAQEEIFGPVIALLPAADEAEAIAIANDTVYGLSGYVSGTDPVRLENVVSRLRAGNVHVNGAGLDFKAPFGGYKQSGNGREWGELGMEEFMEIKAVMKPAAA